MCVPDVMTNCPIFHTVPKHFIQNLKRQPNGGISFGTKVVDRQTDIKHPQND